MGAVLATDAGAAVGIGHRKVETRRPSTSYLPDHIHGFPTSEMDQVWPSTLHADGDRGHQAREPQYPGEEDAG